MPIDAAVDQVILKQGMNILLLPLVYMTNLSVQLGSDFIHGSLPPYETSGKLWFITHFSVLYCLVTY